MPETETIRLLSVQNKMGIHARPAAMIVRISNKYPSTELKFIAQGEDAAAMLDEIENLFNRKFDEE